MKGFPKRWVFGAATLALGYPLRDAAYFALSDVDLHEVERLIGNGCPADTAVRIAR